MDLIVCRMNADWDALGSMIAARRLYPNAVLALPANAQTAFGVEAAALFLRSLPLRDITQIDPQAVKRLVLIGTRRLVEIGPWIEALTDRKLEIHLYDNHPAAPDSLTGTLELVRETGACVTILTQLVAEQGRKLMADEATWALVGLFDKTAGFTLPGTTAEDLRAAALLLDWGADLPLAIETGRGRLRPDQLAVLRDLHAAATRRQLDWLGIVTAAVNAPENTPDLAECAARLHESHNGQVTIAVIRQGTQTQVFCFSKLPRLNLVALAEELGGVGESDRFQATVAHAAGNELLEKLPERIAGLARLPVLARDLADPTVPTLTVTDTVADAVKRIAETGLDALPVTDREKPAGIVQVAELLRASRFGLQRMPLLRLLVRPPLLCAPETGLAELVATVEHDPQPYLFVEHPNRRHGIVRREDVLLARAKQSTADLPSLSRTQRDFNLRDALPADLDAVLRQVGALAWEMGYRSALVGGLVRDLILKRSNFDVDLVVEGDALGVARSLATRLAAKLVEHEDFQTATLDFGPYRIDVAMARREWYDRPGELPRVQPGTLRDDARRRDFTVNTLLLDLRPDQYGQLIDFENGYADLRLGLLRILHGLSFIEDPTRVLRAVRFAGRFGFSLEDSTRIAFTAAIEEGCLDRLEGGRWWKELALILNEDKPVVPLEMILRERIGARLHPELRPEPDCPRRLALTEEIMAWYRDCSPATPPATEKLRLAVLTIGLTDAALTEAAARMGMPSGWGEELASWREAASDLTDWLLTHPRAASSEIAGRLRPVPPEAALLAAVTADDKAVDETIRRFFAELQAVKPLLGGEDLRRLGLTPGPQFGELLDRIRDARLDGLIATRHDELNFVNQFLARRRESAEFGDR
ncbi:MAG: CBS domain-containing protein [Myxococcales bacterium]|nr:CBS domain-containing protein [Myxococcales bacterium]